MCYSAIAAGGFLMWQSVWKGKLHWMHGLFGATLVGMNLSHLGYGLEKFDKKFTANVNHYRTLDGNSQLKTAHSNDERGSLGK
jgi:hypothetical protein